MTSSPPVALAPRTPGPLEGIIVLDVSRVVAGPYCTMTLADLGASVIKIEHPKEPDFVRDFPPHVVDDDGVRLGGGYFVQHNRYKYAATLDLADERGKALFRAMVEKVDVVVENFRPGTMTKLGLDYAALSPLNPRLVYCAISGFGQTGPNSRRPSYDSTAQAVGGLWSMNGAADEPPVRVAGVIGDVAASLYACIGILAALREAERTGRGKLIDVAQQDVVVSLTEAAVVDYTVRGAVARPNGSEHPFVRPYGRFRCKDGYVFFGSYSDKLWRDCCEVFGRRDLIDDPEIDTMTKRFDSEVYERRVRPVIESWFAERTKAELEVLAGDRIALAPIKTIDEVVADPHLRARNMFVQVDVGGKPVEVFGSPLKLTPSPEKRPAAAPAVGEDNDRIYCGWLGLAHGEFEALRAAGVI